MPNNIREKIKNNAYDAIMITAGAGMGVDSGLPDFRGNEGFWKAYPAIAKRQVSFEDMANPTWFEQDPRFAWGFYGHRLNLYREVIPHNGFKVLLDYFAENDLPYFVVTSNVDGAFQKAGFSSDNIKEIHGTINKNQCTSCGEVWDNDSFVPEIDQDELLLKNDLPECKACGSVARPNILMFGDGMWNDLNTYEQEKKLKKFLSQGYKNILVVEIGAGIAIPSIRRFSEQLFFSDPFIDLIRINPAHPDGPVAALSLRTGALESLEKLFT